MPIRKTEDEIKSIINAYFNQEKLRYLYDEDYTGETKDTKRNISDLIAEQILKLDDNLENYFNNNIQTINRIPRENEKSYSPKGHNLQREKEEALLREKPLDEKWLAKSLLLNKYNEIGEIKDYEIPINQENNDGAGEIDLIAYNEETNKISLIELKRKDNPETILRAILEICTYYCQINKQQFKKEYANQTQNETEIWKVVMVFENSYQHRQYEDEFSKNIRKLVEKLNIKIFLIDDDNQIKPLVVQI